MKSLTTAALLFAASSAWAQPPQAVVDRMGDYNRRPSVEQAGLVMQALIETSLAGKTPAAPAAAAPPVDANEGRRLALKLLANQQVGAPAGVGAGSSLVSLKSVTDLISGALDSGAFNKSTQGTVATFRANLAATYRLFTGDCPAGAAQSYPACVTENPNAWRGLSIALSFDASRQDQVTPAEAGNPLSSAGALLLRAKRGLSAASVRYDFYRPRDQHSQQFAADWKTAVTDLQSKSQEYTASLEQTAAPLEAEAIEEGKPKQLHDLLMPLLPEQRLAAAQKFVDDFLAAPGHTVSAKKRQEFAAARDTFLKNEVKFFQDTLSRKLFTLEFTDQRPVDEPEYGSVRLVSSFNLGKHTDMQTNLAVPNWEITFNAAGDFFYDTSEVQKGRRLRDFQAAFQADRKLWRWTALNQPTFTLAGYYQRLADDIVIEFNSDALAPGTGIVLPKPANVILQGTKGDVGIAQAKLTIPLGNAGVSFPMAVSWSNRTEILKIPGNDVRGHFGFQFDLDKLLNSFKGSFKKTS